MTGVLKQNFTLKVPRFLPANCRTRKLRSASNLHVYTVHRYAQYKPQMSKRHRKSLMIKTCNRALSCEQLALHHIKRELLQST